MNTILRTEFGSSIYGTRLPTSDTDIKGIFIPSREDILLQRAQKTIVETTKTNPNEKNSSEDVDTELYSLHRYLELLLEGQTVALDILFTKKEFWLESTFPWTMVQRHRQALLHRGTASFAGYCKTQANKYGIKGSRISAVRALLEILRTLPLQDKLFEHGDRLRGLSREHCSVVELPNVNGKLDTFVECCSRKVHFHCTVKQALDVYERIFNEYGKRALQAETNQGVDWKALMHAVRVCRQAEELLLTHHITFPRPECELLLQIRQGLLPYKQVAELIEEGLVRLEAAKAKSTLPAEPDYNVADQLVLDAYEHVVFRR